MALVGANALVSSLSEIAVHAKNLKTGRKFSCFQVIVKIGSAIPLLPMDVTIIVDVVNRQKLGFRFTAASTYRPTICGYDFIACAGGVIVTAAYALLSVSAFSPFWINPQTVI
jgi:hypothetical protein